MVLFMIRTLTASLGLLLASAPAVAAERSYSLTDFDRVQVDGPYEVTLVTGRSSGARAVGSTRALEQVTVEVQGRTLRIHANRSAWGGYPGQDSGPVRLQVTTQDLRGAFVIGSGSLSIDRARGLRLDLSVSGSGKLSVARLDADNLVVGLLGSGRISAAGSAKQLKATIQGSGDFDAPGLRTDDAQIYADTAGTISVAASRTAKVKATGFGDVTVIGTPACTVEALGSGRVRCGRAP
jgi:hypothetical protein